MHTDTSQDSMFRRLDWNDGLYRRLSEMNVYNTEKEKTTYYRLIRGKVQYVYSTEYCAGNIVCFFHVLTNISHHMN